MMTMKEKIDGDGFTPDGDDVRAMIANHAKYTGSTVAERILADWEVEKDKFVRMMPAAFKAVMAKKAGDATPQPRLKLQKSMSVGGSPTATSSFGETTPTAARATTPSGGAGGEPEPEGGCGSDSSTSASASTAPSTSSTASRCPSPSPCHAAARPASSRRRWSACAPGRAP